MKRPHSLHDLPTRFPCTRIEYQRIYIYILYVSLRGTWSGTCIPRYWMRRPSIRMLPVYVLHNVLNIYNTTTWKQCAHPADAIWMYINISITNEEWCMGRVVGVVWVDNSANTRHDPASVCANGSIQRFSAVAMMFLLVRWFPPHKPPTFHALRIPCSHIQSRYNYVCLYVWMLCSCGSCPVNRHRSVVVAQNPAHLLLLFVSVCIFYAAAHDIRSAQ